MSEDIDGPAAEKRLAAPKKSTVMGVVALCFVILAAIFLTISHLRVRYATQSILGQQHELEQTLLDKSLDSVRAWRNEVVEQARFISASEMFRLFIMDTRALAHDEIQKLPDPDTLHSPDEALRAMAEQYTYIQDLLHDFTRRRAWTDARILLPDGSQLVEPHFSPPLSEEQVELAREAVATGKSLFGPIRQTETGLVMDMADPLFEVLSAADTPAVGVLLLTVPMDKPLLTFLGRGTDQGEALFPRIVYPVRNAFCMVIPRDGMLNIELADQVKGIAQLPFMLRTSLDGLEQVYSIGGVPTGLEWLLVLEKPAGEIDDVIATQKIQLYGLGLLAAVGFTLLFAWIWANYTSARYEADAKFYKNLYTRINNLKMMLESVNASFKAGLALIDAHDQVRMSNPTFREICGVMGDIPPTTKLAAVLPGSIVEKIQGDVSRVRLEGKSDSDDDVRLYKDGEELIFRVNFYPYFDEGSKSASGCVAIFQDITRFRRQAEIRRKQQENLISALVRAVESIDPNLVGHSDKMAGVSELLAQKMGMDAKSEKTLWLAAKLSQVGKIDVPRELWSKTGKLTEEERREIGRIPEHADRILGDLDFDLPVRETVGQIAERMDGTGKPRGVAGDAISAEARALAVVDAFIAMTSPRAWRKTPMSVEEAIAQLRGNPGFDQEMVRALGELDAARLAKIVGAPV